MSDMSDMSDMPSSAPQAQLSEDVMDRGEVPLQRAGRLARWLLPLLTTLLTHFTLLAASASRFISLRTTVAHARSSLASALAATRAQGRRHLMRGAIVLSCSRSLLAPAARLSPRIRRRAGLSPAQTHNGQWKPNKGKPSTSNPKNGTTSVTHPAAKLVSGGSPLQRLHIPSCTVLAP